MSRMREVTVPRRRPDPRRWIRLPHAPSRLVVDNLAEVEIVTADGEVRTASREETASSSEGWMLSNCGPQFEIRVA